MDVALLVATVSEGRIRSSEEYMDYAVDNRLSPGDLPLSGGGVDGFGTPPEKTRAALKKPKQIEYVVFIDQRCRA